MKENSKNDGKSSPILGIIVPCYNEENALSFTMDEILKVINNLKNSTVISEKSFVSFVDDGSTDRTWEIISEYNKRFPKTIRGLKLSRNFGHQKALLSGMLNYECDLFVTMDADLQHPPEIIVEMIKKYEQGYDIIYGVRHGRRIDSIFKRFTAFLFYNLIKTLGIKVVYNHADFRLVRKEVINILRDFREVNIFLRGIIPYIGFKSAIVYYEQPERKAGGTKYSLKKMISFAWEGITSFSIVPLRIISAVGFIIFLISLVYSLYILFAKITGKTVVGWTSVILSLYILGGLIILFLGIVGEYIGKIYMEVKQRPRFIIEKKIE